VQRNDIKVSPYDKAKKISVSQFRKIMAAIDTTRPPGALYKAAFLFYVLCGRRRSEVVSLNGRDIRVDDKKVTYKVRLKGGKSKWKEMPPPVWQAIQYYLYSTSRKLEDDKPVFVATEKYRKRTDPLKETKPLRGSTLFKAIKRYARKAGLDPKKVSLHSLRHLGAELFLNASEDLHETQLFLDHAHLNTTQIYLSQLKGEEHNHWQEMANKLRVK
jgi:integrase/recombinase XerD